MVGTSPVLLKGGVKTSDKIELNLSPTNNDYMIYKYTSPNGLVIESETIYNDYFNAPGEEEAIAVKKTLNEMSNKIYQIENDLYVPEFGELNSKAKSDVRKYAKGENMSEADALKELVDLGLVDAYNLY